MKKNIFAVLHTAAAVAIMLIAMICTDFIIYFSPNPTADNLIYTVVYILVTLSLGLLYAKYVLHFSFEEIGISKPPQLKWIIIGICLPLAVTLFYVFFVDGQIIKNDGGSLLFYLIGAVFPVGIASGVCEEFIFRGLIMHIFEKQWNRAAAIFVPSFLFAALHILNMRMGVIDILQLLIAGTAVGVMFSLIAYQSGTIWSGAAVHAIWNAVIIGGVFIIENPADGITANCFYRYEILSDNILLTGGRFGIESALPAVIGYCLISAAAFILLMKRSDKKIQQ